MTDQTVAERFREAREYVGATTAQVAERIPDPVVDEALIVAVENGTADAGPVLLDHLSRVYFRPVEWFRGEFRFELSPRMARQIEKPGMTDGDREAVTEFAEFLACMAAVREVSDA